MKPKSEGLVIPLILLFVSMEVHSLVKVSVRLGVMVRIKLRVRVRVRVRVI